MKQCPNCRTTYTDESLSFCLSDGGALFTISEAEQPTQIAYGRNAVQIDIPPNTAPPASAMPTAQISAPPHQQGRSVFPYVVIAFLALLLIGAIGVGALLYLNPFGKTDVVAVSNANAKPNAATNAAANDQNNELQEKLANLEKQLQEQKNQKKPVTAPPVTNKPATSDPGRPTATVKQTNDGFLSLRTEPSVKTGTQLVKIPSGATVNLENCEKSSVTIDGRRGRWCMVTYNNETGWVFDAFLNY